MLSFFDRGSAFSDAHNCAFFIYGTELVLLDCPMSAFLKLKHAGFWEKIDRIRILVTHTHSDHIGGIPLLIHYAFYALEKPVVIMAPSEQVRDDLFCLTDRIEGCDRAAYTIQIPAEYDADFPVEPIPTRHVPALEGRCFGYHLRVNQTDIVFTGDTCILEPFLPYCKPHTLLYTETAFIQTNVHLHIDAVLPKLCELQKSGVQVYLMHLDAEAEIRNRICGTGILLAPLCVP